MARALIRLKWLRIAFCSLAVLSTALQMLIRQEEAIENDIARYIRRLPKNRVQLKQNHLWNSKNRVERKTEHEKHPYHIVNSIHNGKKLNLTTASTENSFETSPRAALKHENKDAGSSTFFKETLAKQNSLYWNLSCPLEMSMFSGAHMGGDFFTRALKAHSLAEKILPQIEAIDWKSLEGQRIFFVGDSLLRQVFISMACLNWNRVTKYAIPWFENRGVRSAQPNTLGRGPHSKFEEGRVQMEGNVELIYHHGIGDIIELGSEYESHNQGSWTKACYLKKPFTAVTPVFPQMHEEEMSTLTVRREQVIVKPTDIVLINASVHAARGMNLQTIADLLLCKKQMKYPDRSWPSILYVVTGLSHFPTEKGTFEQELLDSNEDFKCRLDTSFHGHQDEEAKKLKAVLPFLGEEIIDIENHSGDLHVGGKDCLHWLQPGIPDLVAVNISQTIALLAKKDYQYS